MSVSLEYTKVKRTGIISTFLVGGLLAGAVPVLNMAFRSKSYLALSGTPLQILLGSNWQMMAMLNVLLVVVGACLMYQTEYTDNSIQRMKTLPIKESNMFFSKALLLFYMCVLVLAIEASTLIFSSLYWFSLNNSFWIELGKNLGYFLILTLPSIMLALFIASACKNMWVSLGISVVCVFLATMLSTKSFILSLFPFAMPFQTLGGADADQILQYTYVAFIEVVVIGYAALIFLKIRRSFE